MDSSRDTLRLPERPRSSFFAPDPRASLFGPERASYRIFRDHIGRIIGTEKEHDPEHNSPAVQHILAEITDLRITVMEETEREKLVALVATNPALRLNRAPVGARIFVMLHGGPDSHTIKYLNDELVGPEVTNAILDKRNAVIAEALDYFGLASDDQCIAENHKTVHYIVDDRRIEQVKQKILTMTRKYIPTDSRDVLNYITIYIEDDVKKAIKNILLAHCKTLASDPSKAAQIANIQHWIDTELDRLTLNFGLSDNISSEPGTSKPSTKERFWADHQAEWSARIAHVESQAADTQAHPQRRGETFELKRSVDKITAARNEVLQDPSLREFFEAVIENDEHFLVLKSSVVHDLRKWDVFQKEHAYDHDLLSKYARLRQYYRTINCLDYIIPWVDLDGACQAIEMLKRTITSGDISDLRDVLTHDQRDHEDYSAAFFHLTSLDHPSAYYVSFDAIGIGDLNARDIEITAIRAAMTMSAKEGFESPYALQSEIQAIVTAVGQKVSALIREKIDIAREILGEELPGVQFFSTRGGDEWHVLIPDNDAFTAEKLYLAVTKINAETGLRSAITHKNSQALFEAGRIDDHHQALDHNELNIAFIKEFEKAGLPGVVTMVEGSHTAAYVQHSGGILAIDKIIALSNAIHALNQQGAKVTPDSVVAFLKEHQANKP